MALDIERSFVSSLQCGLEESLLASASLHMREKETSVAARTSSNPAAARSSQRDVVESWPKEADWETTPRHKTLTPVFSAFEEEWKGKRPKAYDPQASTESRTRPLYTNSPRIVGYW